MPNLTASTTTQHAPRLITLSDFKSLAWRIERRLLADVVFGSGLPASEREDAARRIAQIAVDVLCAEE